jgi:two-component system LytT family response regulator
LLLDFGGTDRGAQPPIQLLAEVELMTSTLVTRRIPPDGTGGPPAAAPRASSGTAGAAGFGDPAGAQAGGVDHLRSGSAPEKMMLRAKGRLVLVDKASIDWIDAVGNYVRFNVAGQTYQVRATLSEVEHALPAGRFLRMHRSTIVNLDAVKEFVRVPYGDLVALLKSGRRLTVGRRYRSSIAAALDALPGVPAAR